MRLPTLDRETWVRIFPFLDQAHDVPADQLEDWLAKVTAEHPDIGPPLRAALTLRFHEKADSDFLERPCIFPPAHRSLIGERVGAYTIESLLGRGGMGEVWLARRSDGHFKGQFAVKLLDPASRAAFALDRFRREGRLLARLAHPNIARLIDAGVMPEGRPYLILDYVNGEHIDHYCNARSLGLEARVRLFLRVTAAVAHAHTNLIVHRDIKPSNVLVTPDGDVKLLDFGVAKLIGNDLADEEQPQATRIEDVALTPDYAAPEQILGDPPSTATDVYQLGVLLHLLLAGQLPLVGSEKTRADRIRAALDEIPPRMSDVAPAASRRTLRGDLDVIVAKALRKRAEERYATAAALGADLERFLAHEPVRAREGAFAYFAAKFIRRHRGAVAGSVVAVITLVAVASFAVVQMREARFHERRGEAENQFLTRVMSTVGSNGKPVTPKEILDKGLAMLERQYRNDPSLRADLLIRMASSFLNVGDNEKGYATLVQAEKIAEQLNDPSLIAQVQCAVVEPAVIKGSLAEAAARLSEGLSALARIAHPGVVVRARCLDAQAFVAAGRGDTQGAIQNVERALAMLDAAGETRDTVYMSVLSHITALYDESGDTLKEFEFAQRQVAALEKNGWSESENAVVGHLNLAVAYYDFGEYKAALADATIAVTRARGGTNGELIEAPLNLAYGRLLARFDRNPEALHALNDSVTAAQRDQDALSELPARSNLAEVLTHLGRFDDAEAELEKVRELARNNQAESAESLAAADLGEAVLLRASGKMELAKAQVDAILAVLQANRTLHSGYVAYALLEASRIALLQRRFSDADAYATEALGLYLKRARKPEWSGAVGEAELLLAKAQRGEGYAAQSRDSARRAVVSLTSAFGGSHALSLEAMSLT